MSNNKSEIYKMGYEKWEGKRDRATPAWILIGQHSLRNLVSSSGCFGRLMFGAFYIIYYFWITLWCLGHFQWENLKGYDMIAGIAQMFESSGITLTEADYHRYFIVITSLIFTAIASLFYGSQLIAKDKRANAMQVYFSKAISRFDYIFGKFFAMGIITASVTLMPSAFILLMGTLLTTDHLQFFQDSWYIPFLTGAYWLLITLMFGSLTLMFSSFFDKSYMAGVSIIGFLLFFIVFSTLMVKVVGAGNIMNGTNWIANAYDIGTVIYKLEVADFGKFFWQVVDSSVLVAGCIYMILRNIRPVEVVS